MAEKTSLTHRGHQRRMGMIRSAEALFLKFGFEATTLDMIIEQSGGSRSTLYSQFGGKEGIFSAVIESMIEEIFDDVVNSQPKVRTVEGTLKYVGTKFITNIISPKAIALFRLIVSETPKFPELGDAFFTRGPQRSFNLLAEELAQLNLNLSEKEINQIAGQFLEMLKGELFIKALSYSDFQPEPKQIESQIEMCVTMMSLYIHQQQCIDHKKP
ncbi:TetR/AcrR family transcriptional regulator [Wohlfahrtiimonas larvae]|uniref:Efflux system transcriptional repressor NalC n=1 Tax=Wohlfahrtiimonas larvae TaxID=1157986 RepID=A0ABP9MR17_9GAMM|nr:TetR/AcrR family transcriptional regulator [Wohlfahrtiimonas larvae]